MTISTLKQLGYLVTLMILIGYTGFSQPTFGPIGGGGGVTAAQVGDSLATIRNGTAGWKIPLALIPSPGAVSGADTHRVAVYNATAGAWQLGWDGGGVSTDSNTTQAFYRAENGKQIRPKVVGGSNLVIMDSAQVTTMVNGGNGPKIGSTGQIGTILTNQFGTILHYGVTTAWHEFAIGTDVNFSIVASPSGAEAGLLLHLRSRGSGARGQVGFGVLYPQVQAHSGGAVRADSGYINTTLTSDTLGMNADVDSVAKALTGFVGTLPENYVVTVTPTSVTVGTLYVTKRTDSFCIKSNANETARVTFDYVITRIKR